LLVGWTFGGIFAAIAFFKEGIGPLTLFLFVWLVFWALAWIIVLLTILWILVGKEIITASPGKISYRYEIFNIGKTKVFSVSNIEIFSIVPPSFSPLAPFIMGIMGQQMGGPLWLKDKSVKSKNLNVFSSSFYPKVEGVVHMGDGLDLNYAITLAKQIKERAEISDSNVFGF
jgi:hypothetical protein